MGYPAFAVSINLDMQLCPCDITTKIFLAGNSSFLACSQLFFGFFSLTKISICTVSIIYLPSLLPSEFGTDVFIT